MISKIKFFCLLFCIPFLQAASCSLKMQDAGFDPSIQTVFIANVENTSELINPLLAVQLQEEFKQKIVNESPLRIVPNAGDQNFYIVIKRYTISPIAPKPGDAASRNRLTIEIEVESDIKNQEDKAWKATFSRFAEYDASVPLSNIESQLLSEIIPQLNDDMFRKAFVNW